MMRHYVAPEKIARFRKIIWRYYAIHKRNFPWRKTHDAYHILVSEIMLQQTQVSRVLGKYDQFLKKFPTLRAVARASLRDVLREWQGLGYNRRAVNLKRLAEKAMKDFGGKLPKDFETLKKLPGIGQSTAGAVMAFAFNKPSVFIETNIRRTFIHFFFPRKKTVYDDEIHEFIARTMDTKNPREWYWALFDYGAMLGETKRSKNPNRRSAHYHKQSKFEGSRRQLRGEILRLLLKAPRSKDSLVKATKRMPKEIFDVLQKLKVEKILVERRGEFSVI